MAELRKYAAGSVIYFPLIDAGAADFEATPVTFVAGDVQVSKDGGGFANATNLVAHLGLGIYSLALIAAELTAAKVLVVVKDQTVPKAWEDQAINIATYGHASAEHAFDLDTATVVASDLTDKTGMALTAAEHTALADEIWDELRAGHVAAGSFGQGVSSVQGAVTGSVASVTGNVAGNVSGNLVGTIGDLSATAKASVEAQVDEALVAINLDHFITQASTVSDATPAANNFDTGLPGAVDNNAYQGLHTKFIAGALAGQVREVSSSVGNQLTFGDPFTDAPANGDAFVFIPGTPVSISAATFWDDLEGTEPLVPIGGNASFRQIMQHLKRRFFNKVTQTTSLQTIFRDDNSTVLETMVVSDDLTTLTQTKGRAT